jgi:hypothetical protein
MPIVKVALKEGRTLEVLVQISDSIMQTCIDVLQLPNEDRNIRILEYKKELKMIESSSKMDESSDQLRWSFEFVNVEF